MHKAEWSLQDAKNKFSEVVNAASEGEPQIVTKRGVPAAVVLSIKEFSEFQRVMALKRPSFTEHLLNIPIDSTGESVEIPPLNIAPRDFL